MPAKRELTMRQLRYLLRLHHDGVTPVMRQHHVAGDKAFVDYSGSRQRFAPSGVIQSCNPPPSESLARRVRGFAERTSKSVRGMLVSFL